MMSEVTNKARVLRDLREGELRDLRDAGMYSQTWNITYVVTCQSEQMKSYVYERMVKASQNYELVQIPLGNNLRDAGLLSGMLTVSFRNHYDYVLF